MKHTFYYLRDNEKRPLVTVCLAYGKKGYKARGIAICSDKDQPSKKTGRAIAKGRARSAFLSGNSSPVNTWRAREILRSLSLGSGKSGKFWLKCNKCFSSRLNKDFTIFELSLFERLRRVAK